MTKSTTGGPRPNTEVPERAKRRRFSAEYKLRVLQEADRCGPGEVGALLRREGLYSSHLTVWRRQRDEGGQFSEGIQVCALADADCRLPPRRGPYA